MPRVLNRERVEEGGSCRVVALVMKVACDREQP
jgi:hypothetical protein